MGQELETTCGRVFDIYDHAKPLLEIFADKRLPPPRAIADCAKHALTHQFTTAVTGGIAELDFAQAKTCIATATRLQITLDLTFGGDLIDTALLALVDKFARDFKQVAAAIKILSFAHQFHVPQRRHPEVEDAFWRCLDLPAVKAASAIDKSELIAFGVQLGFATSALQERIA